MQGVIGSSENTAQAAPSARPSTNTDRPYPVSSRGLNQIGELRSMGPDPSPNAGGTSDETQARRVDHRQRHSHAIARSHPLSRLYSRAAFDAAQCHKALPEAHRSSSRRSRSNARRHRPYQRSKRQHLPCQPIELPELGRQRGAVGSKSDTRPASSRRYCEEGRAVSGNILKADEARAINDGGRGSLRQNMQHPLEKHCSR